MWVSNAVHRFKIALILNAFICALILRYQQIYQQLFALEKHLMTQHDTKTAQPLPNSPKRQAQKNRLGRRFDLLLHGIKIHAAVCSTSHPLHANETVRGTGRLPVRYWLIVRRVNPIASAA